MLWLPSSTIKRLSHLLQPVRLSGCACISLLNKGANGCMRLSSLSSSNAGRRCYDLRFMLGSKLYFRRTHISSRRWKSDQQSNDHRRKNNEVTIYALSTPPGRGAIAVIRISGASCLRIYDYLCPDTEIPLARRATVRTISQPTHPSLPSKVENKTAPRILDAEAIVLWMPGPHSVTGEDMLELHLHGGPAIVKAVLNAIAIAGRSFTNNTADPATGNEERNPRRSWAVRYAEPGEFTRRAFYNQRMDLNRIEALGDALAAETEQQRFVAVQNASNGESQQLTRRYEAWRQDLVDARGQLEALIDFSEDQHFDETIEDMTSGARKKLVRLRDKIAASVRNADRGELLRNGIKVALLGPPNAGKSSLLNAILGREAAIVSPEAGTTRDVLEANIDIGGFFCKFFDLAGLRAENSPISTKTGLSSDHIGAVEREGMRRARDRVREADLVLILGSVEQLELGSENHGEGTSMSDKDNNTLHSFVREARALLGEDEGEMIHQTILVLNKIDLLPPSILLHSASAKMKAKFKFLAAAAKDNRNSDGPEVFPISCLVAKIESDAESKIDAGGLDRLLDGLKARFVALTEAEEIDLGGGPGDRFGTGSHSLGASQRVRLLLQECLDRIDGFLAAAEAAREEDIVPLTEELRAAADCLARVTGRTEGTDVEEILGVVFENFCVGK